MGISGALRELAGFVEECERADGVDRVDLNGAVEPATAGGVTTTVELELDLRGSEPTFRAGSATVGADGRLTIEVESHGVVPATTDLAVEPIDAVATGDGTVAVTLSIRSADRDPDGASPAANGADDAGSDGRSETDRDPGATESSTGTPPDDESPSPAENDAATPAGEDATTSGENGVVAAERDRDVPPFEDPELLAEVYERCDTFAEMTDALGMSVTAETVRRYMMDFGIHEPNRYATGDAAETDDEAGDGDSLESVEGDEGTDVLDDETDALDDGGTDAPGERSAGTDVDDGLGVDAGADDPDEDGAGPVVVTDGVGLPDDVTVEALIDTVRRSNTIYEVTRGLGIDREDALEMLRDLDLLSLVVGRLATEADRDLSREEIVDQIRQASETG